MNDKYDILGLGKQVDMSRYNGHADDTQQLNTYQAIMRKYGNELFDILDRTFEDYYFVRKLGSGAFGTVYSIGFNGFSDRKAVKIIEKNPWDEREQFKLETDKEVIFQNNLAHETPMVLYLQVLENTYFWGADRNLYAVFVMDKIPDHFQSLSSLLNSKDLSHKQINDIVYHIFYILQRLRVLGYTHYDLHFGNIWVNAKKLEDLPIIIDFGEARSLVNTKTDLLITIRSAFFITNKHNKNYTLKGLVNLYNQLFPQDPLPKTVGFRTIDKLISQYK